MQKNSGTEEQGKMQTDRETEEQKKKQIDEQGVLENDALIYRKDRDKSRKEIIDGMDTKGKLQYFIQYYAMKSVLLLVLVCLIIYLTVHFFTKKEMAMGILAVNGDGANPVATDASYFSGFLEENGYNPEKTTVNLNYSMYLKTGSDDGISRTSLEMIQVLFFTQAIDVFMADEEFFTDMAQKGYVADLEDYLSGELLEKYSDSLVYTDVVIPDEESGGYETEYRLTGVRLEPDNGWIAGTGWYDSPVIVGIADGSVNRELAVKMIEDMLQ